MNTLTQQIPLIIGGLFRYKWRILAFQLLTVLGVIGAILVWPRTYMSESRIYVRVGRETLNLDPTATTGQMTNLSQTDRDAEITSVLEVMRSRAIMMKTVERVGADVIQGDAPIPEPRSDGEVAGRKKNAMVAWVKSIIGGAIGIVKSIDPVPVEEEAMQDLESGLDIGASRDSWLIAATYEADDPKLAQYVLKNYVDVAVDEYLRLNRTEGSEEFFAAKMKAAQQELTTALERTRQLKDGMQLTSVEGHRTKLETMLSTIQTDLNDTRRGSHTAEAQLVDLEAQLAALPTRVVAAVEGEDEDEVAGGKAGDDVAVVRRALKVRVQDKDLNERAFSQSLALDVARQRATLEGLQARQATLMEQEAKLLAELSRLNQFEIELEEVNRQTEVARKNYFRYVDSWEQARVDSQLEDSRITNLGVVQPATYWTDPVSPSKLILIAAGMMLCLTVPIAYVVTVQAVGDILRGPADVEQITGAPVFGAIPKSVRQAKVLD